MAKIKQSNLNTEQCSKKESVLEKSSYAVTCKTRHTKTSLEKSKEAYQL